MRTLLVSALFVSLFMGAGCEPKRPARLSLRPAGPFQMTRVGETEQVKPMAYDDKSRPFAQALEVIYRSSDESVARVSSDGTITATGSGEATITAEAEGVSAAASIAVQVVGSVEIVGDPPATLKFGGNEYALQVVVKDDKGRPIERPKLSFAASDYCVEVSPTGVVRPLTVGACEVEVRAADKTAHHAFRVR